MGSIKQYLVVILLSLFAFILGSGNQNACQSQCSKKVNTPSQTTTCPVLKNYAIVTDSTIAKHARKLVLKQGSKTDLCSALHRFSKYVKVFDLYFVATTKSPDYKVLHAASVLYQYLDNDDDGKPDNKLVYDQLVELKATMFMFYDSKEFDANPKFIEDASNNCPYVILQDLQSHETHPASISASKFDASLEETFHLITTGYFAVYPELSAKSGTHMSCIMDCARGGKFENEPPWPYPVSAWYSYNDKTCKYVCMAVEYIYWGLTTYLGAHQTRKEMIAREWRPHTCEELKRIDEPMYNLIRDPKYKFPKKLPVGVFFNNGKGVTGNAVRLNSISRSSLLLIITLVIVNIA